MQTSSPALIDDEYVYCDYATGAESTVVLMREVYTMDLLSSDSSVDVTASAGFLAVEQEAQLHVAHQGMQLYPAYFPATSSGGDATAADLSTDRQEVQEVQSEECSELCWPLLMQSAPTSPESMGVLPYAKGYASEPTPSPHLLQQEVRVGALVPELTCSIDSNSDMFSGVPMADPLMVAAHTDNIQANGEKRVAGMAAAHVCTLVQDDTLVASRCTFITTSPASVVFEVMLPQCAEEKRKGRTGQAWHLAFVRARQQERTRATMLAGVLGRIYLGGALYPI